MNKPCVSLGVATIISWLISIPLLLCLFHLLVTVFIGILSRYLDNFGVEGSAATGAYVVAATSAVILCQAFIQGVGFVWRFADALVSILFSVDGEESQEALRLASLQMLEFKPNFTAEQVRQFCAEYGYHYEYAYIWILTEKPVLEKLSFSCPDYLTFKVMLSDRILYEGHEFDLAMHAFRSMYPTHEDWVAQKDKLNARNGNPTPTTIEA